MMYRNWGKRGLDLLLAGGALVVLLPLLLALSGLVLCAMGRPVLFRQQRAGLHGQPFMLLKFRTMHVGDASDAERLTGLGRVLRIYGFDELPQLFNVLRGEMSLVGPRPLPVHYAVPALRCAVRPGITGPVQTGGRNALPWARRFEMDVAYVHNLSLRADLAYLLRTPAALLRRDEACTPGFATAIAPGEND